MPRQSHEQPIAARRHALDMQFDVAALINLRNDGADTGAGLVRVNDLQLLGLSRRACEVDFDEVFAVDRELAVNRDPAARAEGKPGGRSVDK